MQVTGPWGFGHPWSRGLGMLKTKGDMKVVGARKEDSIKRRKMSHYGDPWREQRKRKCFWRPLCKKKKKCWHWAIKWLVLKKKNDDNNDNNAFIKMCIYFTHTREMSPLSSPFWSSPISSVSQCRALHTTISRRGLEEFFDLPENWGETNIKSGEEYQLDQSS